MDLWTFVNSCFSLKIVCFTVEFDTAFISNDVHWLSRTNFIFISWLNYLCRGQQTTWASLQRPLFLISDFHLGKATQMLFGAFVSAVFTSLLYVFSSLMRSILKMLPVLAISDTCDLHFLKFLQFLPYHPLNGTLLILPYVVVYCCCFPLYFLIILWSVTLKFNWRSQPT